MTSSSAPERRPDGGHHEHHAHDRAHVAFCVLTISSSRTLDDDPSGDRIVDLVEDAGHSVVARELVADDPHRIRTVITEFIDGESDVVITTGGTGVTPDDVTVEVVEEMFDKQLPGFGELFRQLSYDEIGVRIVGTRSTAGIVGETVVFCLPGSENAVQLGTAEIILGVASHLVGLAGGHHR